MMMSPRRAANEAFTSIWAGSSAAQHICRLSLPDIATRITDSDGQYCAIRGLCPGIVRGAALRADPFNAH
jgi:hypothetical protein